MSQPFAGREAQVRALRLALGLNAGYMIVEIAGGVLFGSLALLADAVHMSSDVVGLVIALIAQRLLSRPASAGHTYGLQRAEVLGALTNGLLLFAASGWIFFEAYRRLSQPRPIEGPSLLVVAVLGLAVNLLSAWILWRAQGGSLNMRGALWHMASDALGSVAVILAAIAVIGWGVLWVDPAASIVIGGIVLFITVRLMKETVHVLLEGTPRGMKLADVEGAIADHPSVESVHHVHLWSLASDTPALSAHVVLEGEKSLHEAQQEGDRIKEMLAGRFGIEHATLELECHDCEPGERRSPPVENSARS